MIINTKLPDNFENEPLLTQERALSEILKNIYKAEDLIREKLSIVRGKISLGNH